MAWIFAVFAFEAAMMSLVTFDAFRDVQTGDAEARICPQLLHAQKANCLQLSNTSI
jgi:hypothetical protein